MDKGLNKIWKPFAHFVQEKASSLTAVSKIQNRPQTSTTPNSHLLCVGDVSGKAWPMLVTTQPVGVYPKILLGFSTYSMSSLAPTYCILSVRSTDL